MLTSQDHRHDCALQFALAVHLAEQCGENPNNCRSIMKLWVTSGFAHRYRELIEIKPEEAPNATDKEGVRTFFEKVKGHKVKHEDTS